MTIACVILGISLFPCPTSSKGDFPCLALGVFISLWLLGQYCYPVWRNIIPHTHTHTHTRIHTLAHTSICAHRQTHVHTHTHKSHTNKHTCTSVHIIYIFKQVYKTIGFLMSLSNILSLFYLSFLPLYYPPLSSESFSPFFPFPPSQPICLRIFLHRAPYSPWPHGPFPLFQLWWLLQVIESNAKIPNQSFLGKSSLLSCLIPVC